MRREYSLKSIFKQAMEAQASDILLTDGLPPMLRVDGALGAIEGDPLDGDQVRALVLGLLNDKQKENLAIEKELEFSLDIRDQQRFRVSLYHQRGRLAATFRLIPNIIPSINDLGLPQVVMDFATRTRGLIIVTGPTGQGKSTTQAAILDLINTNRRCHIITIEDPIEFVHEHKESAVDQREVYADTLGFGRALKHVLRQDPDVILVGEMRDLETISTTLTAAETGHLVITTLHTNDAIQTIDRIIDVYPSYQQAQIRTQLAFCLIGIVAQQLIPRADGEGRVIAAEILINNIAIANLIREGHTHKAETVIQTHVREGMRSMDTSLAELYHAGLITYEEVMRRAKHPKSILDSRQRANRHSQDIDFA
ncbi:PilT/PilU family type 4a pilus ATPase [bacterium]|nr:PilT/PilU family type 4a pilus ATPase [candidate division CSSED10-310 bacterium]